MQENCWDDAILAGYPSEALQVAVRAYRANSEDTDIPRVRSCSCEQPIFLHKKWEILVPTTGALRRRRFKARWEIRDQLYWAFHWWSWCSFMWRNNWTSQNFKPRVVPVRTRSIPRKSRTPATTLPRHWCDQGLWYTLILTSKWQDAQLWWVLPSLLPTEGVSHDMLQVFAAIQVILLP